MTGITFSQVASIGDVMSSDRHTLYFPQLPSGGDSNTLTLRHTTVTLPPWEVGQIIVKMYGWSIAFPGRRNNPNTFNVNFVETTDAPVIKALLSWQAMASGINEPTGSMKSQVAVQAKLVAADTTGKYALTCKLFNVWPQSIQVGGFEESSNAWTHDVTFSIDAVDIDGLTTHEEAIGSLSNMNNRIAPNKSSAVAAQMGMSSGLYNSPSSREAAISASTMISRFF